MTKPRPRRVDRCIQMRARSRPAREGRSLGGSFPRCCRRSRQRDADLERNDAKEKRCDGFALRCAVLALNVFASLLLKSSVMRNGWGVLAGVLLATACNVADAQPASASEIASTRAAVVSSDADRFVGTYHFAGGQAQRTALREAIEELVELLNILVRGTARDKLHETNPVFDRVTIERSADSMVLTFGTLKNACKIDGSATQVEGIDGSKLTCRLSIKNGALVQQLSGSRGGRDNTLTLDEHGKLRVKTRIHSRLMPKDLHYTLTYARR